MTGKILQIKKKERKLVVSSNLRSSEDGNRSLLWESFVKGFVVMLYYKIEEMMDGNIGDK